MRGTVASPRLHRKVHKTVQIHVMELMIENDAAWRMTTSIVAKARHVTFPLSKPVPVESSKGLTINSIPSP
jgi:hypothetical protein